MRDPALPNRVLWRARGVAQRMIPNHIYLSIGPSIYVSTLGGPAARRDQAAAGVPGGGGGGRGDDGRRGGLLIGFFFYGRLACAVSFIADYSLVSVCFCRISVREGKVNLELTRRPDLD